MLRTVSLIAFCCVATWASAQNLMGPNVEIFGVFDSFTIVRTILIGVVLGYLIPAIVRLYRSLVQSKLPTPPPLTPLPALEAVPQVLQVPPLTKREVHTTKGFKWIYKGHVVLSSTNIDMPPMDPTLYRNLDESIELQHKTTEKTVLYLRVTTRQLIARYSTLFSKLLLDCTTRIDRERLIYQKLKDRSFPHVQYVLDYLLSPPHQPPIVHIPTNEEDRINCSKQAIYFGVPDLIAVWGKTNAEIRALNLQDVQIQNLEAKFFRDTRKERHPFLNYDPLFMVNIDDDIPPDNCDAILASPSHHLHDITEVKRFPQHLSQFTLSVSPERNIQSEWKKSSTIEHPWKEDGKDEEKKIQKIEKAETKTDTKTISITTHTDNVMIVKSDKTRENLLQFVGPEMFQVIKAHEMNGVYFGGETVTICAFIPLLHEEGPWKTSEINVFTSFSKNSPQAKALVESIMKTKNIIYKHEEDESILFVSSYPNRHLRVRFFATVSATESLRQLEILAHFDIDMECFLWDHSTSLVIASSRGLRALQKGLVNMMHIHQIRDRPIHFERLLFYLSRGVNVEIPGKWEVPLHRKAHPNSLSDFLQRYEQEKTRNFPLISMNQIPYGPNVKLSKEDCVELLSPSPLVDSCFYL